MHASRCVQKTNVSSYLKCREVLSDVDNNKNNFIIFTNQTNKKHPALKFMLINYNINIGDMYSVLLSNYINYS